ncbi:CGNR zinc finger domain-containing protein [Caldibacillus debilis]|uniref:CGNR zinc finger domain-containing protein n=1 Tax=Caldibacillus debilis TaxID=301148 RepID=UPI000EA8B23F
MSIIKVCEASDCNKRFIQTHPRRRYCSPKCAEREKRRRYVKKRISLGLCVQCGKPMDYPTSPHKNKTSPLYCSACQDYFRKRYLEKKKQQKTKK